MIILLKLLLAAGITYLLLSFITWNFTSFGNWSTDGRIFFVLMTIGISTILNIEWDEK